MSESKKTKAAETEKEKEVKVQVYYRNDEVREKLKKILMLNEIEYLTIKVRTKEIELVQVGDHDSASATADLFNLPGVFGYSQKLVKVAKDADQFGIVTRTITKFDRSKAKPMYQDDGVNDEDEGTHLESETSPED